MRVLVIAVGCVVCALATGLMALWAQLMSLPRTDTAYGMSISQTLHDPFVLTVWLTFTIAGAVPGFFVALWALWRVQLAKAFPLIFTVSVLSAGLAAVVFMPLSPVIALVAATGVMIWCKYHQRWSEPPGSMAPVGGGPLASGAAAPKSEPSPSTTGEGTGAA